MSKCNCYESRVSGIFICAYYAFDMQSMHGEIFQSSKKRKNTREISGTTIVVRSIEMNGEDLNHS